MNQPATVYRVMLDAKHTGEAGGDWETIKPRRKVGVV